MGHWHIASQDPEANKKLFLAMGGKLFMPGGNPLIMFPGLFINLNLGTEKGDGGTQGSVVNHVGFIVDNVQTRVAQWKAAGVKVLPGLRVSGPDFAFYAASKSTYQHQCPEMQACTSRRRRESRSISFRSQR
jgi:hypothetical protein